jgi:hypothetical protein
MGNAATEGWTPQAAKSIEAAARFTQEGWSASSKARAQRAPAAAAAAPQIAARWGQAAAGWEAAAAFLEFGDFEYVPQTGERLEREGAPIISQTQSVWVSEAKWQEAAKEWVMAAKEAVTDESAAWTASLVHKAKAAAELAQLTAQEVAEHDASAGVIVKGVTAQEVAEHDESAGVLGKWSAAALAWQEASQSKDEVETARAIESAAEATSVAWSATSRTPGAPTRAQEHGKQWADTAAMWERAADYIVSGDFGESMHPALAAQTSPAWYSVAALFGLFLVSGITVSMLRARRIHSSTNDAATPFL